MASHNMETDLKDFQHNSLLCHFNDLNKVVIYINTADLLTSGQLNASLVTFNVTVDLLS